MWPGVSDKQADRQNLPFIITTIYNIYLFVQSCPQWQDASLATSNPSGYGFKFSWHEKVLVRKILGKKKSYLFEIEVTDGQVVRAGVSVT